jgi:hypothetical protein
MSVREVDYHYVRTGSQSEPRKYAFLAEVLTWIKDLINLQRGRGFVTTRENDGKNSSPHPDGRTVQFWAENARGDIVS